MPYVDLVHGPRKESQTQEGVTDPGRSQSRYFSVDLHPCNELDLKRGRLVEPIRTTTGAGEVGLRSYYVTSSNHLRRTVFGSKTITIQDLARYYKIQEGVDPSKSLYCSGALCNADEVIFPLKTCYPIVAANEWSKASVMSGSQTKLYTITCSQTSESDSFPREDAA
jgi:hypothetical protein